METRSLDAPFVAADKPKNKKRRRPSGEAPPLPRQLYASGKYWLGLVLLSVIAWATFMLIQGAGPKATRVDMAMLDLIAQLRSDLFTKIARGLHALGSE